MSANALLNSEFRAMMVEASRIWEGISASIEAGEARKREEISSLVREAMLAGASAEDIVDMVRDFYEPEFYPDPQD
jgi:hypothetical protein